MIFKILIVQMLISCGIAHADHNAITECKEIDYHSYYKIENIKNNIIKTNPDKLQPNFSQKYLLLKNEYLFDTSWFVVDCTTGKFIHEMLTMNEKNSQNEFNLKSNELISTNGKVKEYFIFQNEKWIKIDKNIDQKQNNPIIMEHPEKVKVLSSCKEIDFSSNDRFANLRKTIIENNPDLTKPNFANHFLLLKVETLFAPYWIMVDCLTGKINSEIINEQIEFNSLSNKIKITSSSKYATESYWIEDDQQWLNLSGTSTIKGKVAKSIYEFVPNQEKLNLIRFKNIKYKISNLEILIKNGKCNQEDQKYTCELEIQI